MPTEKPVRAAVKALIVHEGEFLMVRDAHDQRWEFPGGNVAYGETPYEALEREIREELGIGIVIHEPVGLCWSITAEREVVMTVLRCTPLSLDFDLSKNPSDELIGEERFFTKDEFLKDAYVAAHHNVKELIRSLDI
jgi:8-oxo-dGTP pyrophosphatase MutT (NUDIX family)